MTCERSARACAKPSLAVRYRCFDFVPLGCQQLRGCEFRSCRAPSRCEPGSVPGAGPMLERPAVSRTSLRSIAGRRNAPGQARRRSDGFRPNGQRHGKRSFRRRLSKRVGSSAARGRAVAKSAVDGARGPPGPPKGGALATGSRTRAALAGRATLPSGGSASGPRNYLCVRRNPSSH